MIFGPLVISLFIGKAKVAAVCEKCNAHRLGKPKVVTVRQKCHTTQTVQQKIVIGKPEVATVRQKCDAKRVPLVGKYCP